MNDFYKIEKDDDIEFIISEKGYGKENWELQQRINKAIELLERYDDRENNYYVPVMETIDILKGSDSND